MRLMSHWCAQRAAGTRALPVGHSLHNPSKTRERQKWPKHNNPVLHYDNCNSLDELFADLFSFCTVSSQIKKKITSFWCMLGESNRTDIFKSAICAKATKLSVKWSLCILPFFCCSKNKKPVPLCVCRRFVSGIQRWSCVEVQRVWARLPMLSVTYDLVRSLASIWRLVDQICEHLI